MATKEEKITPVEKSPTEEKRTYCYIGPNLPDGILKKNALLIGTKKDIKEKFKSEIEAYPQLEKLIIKVDTLAEAKAKIETNGNIMHKYYQDIASTLEAKKESGE